MSGFQDFLNRLDTLRDRPVKLKQIKKILKITEKSFPPCKNISNYYFQEFSKRTNEEHRTKWHKKDKVLFVWTVLKYFELQNRDDLNPTDDDWHYLSTVLGITEQLLNLKWISLLKTNLKMAPWNMAEDELLRTIIQDPPLNWTDVTIEFNRMNPCKVIRHAKQIRERWNNYINPDLKKCEWAIDEQIQLLKLSIELGKRWSLIAKQIHGRTENQVKNQYNSMMNGFRRANALDNEDVAVRRLLSQLEGSEFDEPIYMCEKRTRKTTPEEPQKQEDPMLLQQPQQLQPQQQQMYIPIFSPMLQFTPLQYLIQQSPNMQSPYDVTRQTSYSNQFQLFDDLLRSSQIEKKELPFLMKMFGSPPIQPSPTQYQPIQPQPQSFQYYKSPPHQPINHKKVQILQKELLKFDTTCHKDI